MEKMIWTNDLVESELLKMISETKIKTMPTYEEIRSFFGNSKLSNAVRRRGGTSNWAERLNLKIKACETTFGDFFEETCCGFLTNEFNFDCEFMEKKHPYDLLVNESIKIDVKCGKVVFARNSPYYTFNLEKTKPTCDIYVCYCTNENKVIKTYVIPSLIMYGKGQLSIGIKTSKYDKYLDRWDIIKKYDEFYKEIINL